MLIRISENSGTYISKLEKNITTDTHAQNLVKRFEALGLVETQKVRIVGFRNVKLVNITPEGMEIAHHLKMLIAKIGGLKYEG